MLGRVPLISRGGSNVHLSICPSKCERGTLYTKTKVHHGGTEDTEMELGGHPRITSQNLLAATGDRRPASSGLLTGSSSGYASFAFFAGTWSALRIFYELILGRPLN